MDLFEQAAEKPEPNAPEFSVSEISGALKKTIEGAFGRVRIRGEIGRVTRPASGHIYLDLKDEKAVINCNIWKGVAGGLSVKPEEGMEVIATGKLSIFAPQSRYNLIIDQLEIAGEGALMALLEKRKKALAAEGLFDNDRKQALPFLPDKIGVITSRSGAVIRDILHRLQDRFPREVLLWPVTVQGEKCAAEVTAAIEGFNRLPLSHELRPDVLIVARGGGSIEDLWGFNEESVVRAAAASKIPLISAVGHETDTTLIDYAADRRAPTPSAAAEMAVPVRDDLMANLMSLDARRVGAYASLAQNRRRRAHDLARALPRPDTLLATPRQRLDLASTRLDGALSTRAHLARARLSNFAPRIHKGALQAVLNVKSRDLSHLTHRLSPALLRLFTQRKDALKRLDQRLTRLGEKFTETQTSKRTSLAKIPLEQGIERRIQQAQNQLDGQSRLLAALSYQRIIDRGFAVIRNRDGQVLSDIAATKAAGKIEITQKGGTIRAEVKGE